MYDLELNVLYLDCCCTNAIFFLETGLTSSLIYRTLVDSTLKQSTVFLSCFLYGLDKVHI